MTQYKHITRASNFKRVLFGMKNGEHVCSSALLKNAERGKFITYSHPNFLLLPNGVLIRAGDRHLLDPYIDPSNRLNFSLVLEEKKLILGVSTGRQYGSGVDPLLEKMKLNKPSQVLVRSEADVRSGLIYVLHNRRVDLVLGFSTEHEYAAHVSGSEAATEFLPIAEQRPFTLGYTGCTKGEWGDRVVEQINSILEEPEVFESFVHYYKRWLPNSNYAYYDQLLDQALADHIEFHFFRKLG